MNKDLLNTQGAGLRVLVQLTGQRKVVCLLVVVIGCPLKMYTVLTSCCLSEKVASYELRKINKYMFTIKLSFFSSFFFGGERVECRLSPVNSDKFYSCILVLGLF